MPLYFNPVFNPAGRNLTRIGDSGLRTPPYGPSRVDSGAPERVSFSACPHTACRSGVAPPTSAGLPLRCVAGPVPPPASLPAVRAEGAELPPSALAAQAVTGTGCSTGPSLRFSPAVTSPGLRRHPRRPRPSRRFPAVPRAPRRSSARTAVRSAAPVRCSVRPPPHFRCSVRLRRTSAVLCGSAAPCSRGLPAHVE